MYKDDFLQQKLDERIQQDALRALKLPSGKIDFCSNDYIGIVKNRLLARDDGDASSYSYGSTGSRLLAGNYELIEQVETQIATFHKTEAAAIYNSGYDANTGVLSCIPQRGDTILYDALSHASIRDGIRLSFAQSFSFAHNDMTQLEQRLQQAKGNVFIVTESVFSMDGDLCPLNELVALSHRYNAHLVIDEAHSTGIVGEWGEGLVQSMGYTDQVFCRVHTFGKAVGCHGAAVVGSSRLKKYLVNFSRSFIYSTALPEEAVHYISTSYKVFPGLTEERKKLGELIQYFQAADIAYEKFKSLTPIQVVMVPGNTAIKALAQELQENNIDVRAILYPTVPKEKERLRIVLHSFNTMEEVEMLVGLLKA